jgi:hypothetical protein
MNPQITLTGDWKMMNMAKLGIVLQAAKLLGNTGNPMNTGLRAIHYAYFRVRKGGTVRGQSGPVSIWRASSSKCSINDRSLAGLTGLCSK